MFIFVSSRHHYARPMKSVNSIKLYWLAVRVAMLHCRTWKFYYSPTQNRISRTIFRSSRVWTNNGRKAMDYVFTFEIATFRHCYSRLFSTIYWNICIRTFESVYQSQEVWWSNHFSDRALNRKLSCYLRDFLKKSSRIAVASGQLVRFWFWFYSPRPCTPLHSSLFFWRKALKASIRKHNSEIQKKTRKVIDARNIVASFFHWIQSTKTMKRGRRECPTIELHSRSTYGRKNR